MAQPCQQVHPADVAFGGEFEAHPGQGFFEFANARRVESLRIVFRHAGAQEAQGRLDAGSAPGSARKVGRHRSCRTPCAHHVQALGAGLEVVGEEAEVGQVGRAGDAFRQQLADFVRLKHKQSGNAQPVANVDPVDVGGKHKRLALNHGAECEAQGLFRIQRLAAAQGRYPRRGRDGAVVEQLHALNVPLRGHVERVLLPRRGGAETGADAAPRGQVPADLHARGKLAVQGGAEVVVVLKTQRRSQRPRPALRRQFGIAVDCAVGPAPLPRGDRAESRKAVRPGAEALRGQRADPPGIRFAQPDLKAFPAPFRPGGKVQLPAGLPRQIQVHAQVLLPVGTGPERGGRVRPQGGVHAVDQKEIDLMRAQAHAEVPTCTPGGPAAQSRQQRGIHPVAAEQWLKAAREHLLEAEAIGIGKHAF